MAMALPAQINMFSGEERAHHARHRKGTSKALMGQIDRLRQLFTLGIDYAYPHGKHALKDLTIDEAHLMISIMEEVALESTR